ncbi:hypothetical protein AVEN_72444-1 [Araneus ventricosus]|uniref:Uncharacterized protein n=1 Tax=Araneus ventricosus TaxID=182803 RepID=A0A4Y2H8K1_ARAVE|nr:hypothetical protein AVEN_72444-1 [Araneus ventricosus]
MASNIWNRYQVTAYRSRGNLTLHPWCNKSLGRAFRRQQELGEGNKQVSAMRFGCLRPTWMRQRSESVEDKESEIHTDDDDSAHLQRKTLEDLRKSDCSENVDEEAVEQWINENSTLEFCEVLSDVVIVSRVTCGSGETRNFEECPESDKEHLVTYQKLSHGDQLVHTEPLLNCLEQEDERTNAEKMILRNLRSIIRRRGNEKQKQIISLFTKQCGKLHLCFSI